MPTPDPVETSACACLHIEYRPNRYEDGTMSDRWLCQSCGAEFVRWYRIGRSEAEVAAFRVEVAELRATLAAERGDQAGALPGWSWEDGEWKKRGGGLSAVVDRCAEAGLRLGWSWYIFRLDDESLAIRHAANTTAREAMRAADAALAALVEQDAEKKEAPDD